MEMQKVRMCDVIRSTQLISVSKLNHDLFQIQTEIENIFRDDVFFIRWEEN